MLGVISAGTTLEMFPREARVANACGAAQIPPVPPDSHEDQVNKLIVYARHDLLDFDPESLIKDAVPKHWKIPSPKRKPAKGRRDMYHTRFNHPRGR